MSRFYYTLGLTAKIAIAGLLCCVFLLSCRYDNIDLDSIYDYVIETTPVVVIGDIDTLTVEPGRLLGNPIQVSIDHSFVRVIMITQKRFQIDYTRFSL